MAPAGPFLLDTRPEQFRASVHAIFQHYVDPDLRSKLRTPHESLRLGEDLGLDSLTMMEIAIRLEDVLQISITDDELRHLRTLGEVRQLIERAAARKAAGELPPAAVST